MTKNIQARVELQLYDLFDQTKFELSEQALLSMGLIVN